MNDAKIKLSYDDLSKNKIYKIRYTNVNKLQNKITCPKTIKITDDICNNVDMYAIAEHNLKYYPKYKNT